MNSILVAPHNDDEVLWASVIALRMKPRIVVVTDSYVQYNRGQTEITAERRRKESEESARILGCEVRFLGLRDDQPLTEKNFNPAMDEYYRMGGGFIFVPAEQGGHPHHDAVSRMVTNALGGGPNPLLPRVICYSTYAKGQNKTPYGLPLKITEVERVLKAEAIRCHMSQHWQGHINEVLMDSEEYIS